MKEEKYIILNKPFIGGYLNAEGHDAHEIINFYLADDGRHYIYNNPYGQSISVQNGMKPEVEYVVFTSSGTGPSTENKSFYIRYIAEIKHTLHTQTISKANVYQPEKLKKYVEASKNEINENLRYLYDISLDDITYDGARISDLFSDEFDVPPFTFECSNMYEPAEIVYIDGSDLDYNFQRNTGFVSEKNKNSRTYEVLQETIKEIIKNTRPTTIQKFQFASINRNQDKLRSLDNDLFLDLISQHKEEESYTKMLGNLINCDGRLIQSFVSLLLERSETDSLQKLAIEGELQFKSQNIVTEYSVSKVGRIDLYTESENYRLIIENKIDSGINDLKDSDGKNVDQLNRYYDHFSNLDHKSNQYILLVPEYRIDDIKKELELLPNDMSNYWQIVGYSFICDFIRNNEEIIRDTRYGKYYDDILLLCIRQSLEKDELFNLKLTKNRMDRMSNK